jgi:hypothetical protein
MYLKPDIGLPLICGTQYRSGVALWDGWFAVYTDAEMQRPWN